MKVLMAIFVEALYVSQGVMQHMVEEKGLDVICDSAGTSNYHIGDPPDSRTMQILEKNGIKLHHRGQQLIQAHFREFDYILCMDEDNLRNAKRIQPKNGKAKLHLLGEFDPKGEKIIQDPYYGGIEGFEKNYEQAVRSCEGFLKHVQLL